MTGRFFIFLLPTVFLCGAGQATAETGSIEVGRQLSAIYCGSCHALTDDDTGANAGAPAFRDTDSGLMTAVDNGSILEVLSSQHPDVPLFDITPNQAASIVAYIGSIKAATRGHELIEANCSPCHSVEKSGTSPHPDAPLFRTLSRAYPVSNLEEALAEGIMTGHEDMPEFVAEPEQIDDMIAYLESIQEE